MNIRKTCALCGAEFDLDQKFCPNDGTPLRMPLSTDTLVGQIVADRYHILSVLGEGGMGRVYLAEHVRMGRRSAVKVINPAMATSADAVARFNREAANASRINHPNVAQTYDFGEGPDGTLYLAMEYVEGETLGSLIRREGAIPLRRAAAMSKQVADALAAAHHLGIVHRDLKPENILVTTQLDGSEWVKVVDFGIAKTVQGDGNPGGQTVTTVGVSLGTPEYMSPEQLAGERLDARTDLYSLGLVFFNLLTADMPYPRVTSRETLIRRLGSAPRTLVEMRPDIEWPPDVQRVVDRALDPDPQTRYPTATDFGRALSALATSAAALPEITIPLKSAGLVPLPLDNAPTAVDRGMVAPTLAEGMPARTIAERQSWPARSRRPVFAAVGMVGVAGLAWWILNLRTPDRVEVGMASSPSADSQAAVPPTIPTVVPGVTGGSGSAAPETASVSSVRPTVPHPAAPPPAVTRADTALPTTSPPPTTAAPAPPGGIGPLDPAARMAALVPRHPYLRANGDSVVAPPIGPNAGPVIRIAAIRQDIDGHVARGMQYLTAREMGKSRNEFRQAVEEMGAVAQLLPNNPATAQMRESLIASLQRAVAQCQTANTQARPRAPTSFSCAQLAPQRFLQGRRGKPPVQP